jgi:hypothetical protein
MRHYSANEKVGPGVYFSLEQLSFESIEDEGCLPGTGFDHYYRVPNLAFLFVGPFLGLAYVLFLPFIGFTMLGSVAAVRLGRLLAEAAAAGVRGLEPAWQPAMAFLSKERGKRARSAAAAGTETVAAKRATVLDPWAEEIRKELAKRKPDAA